MSGRAHARSGGAVWQRRKLEIVIVPGEAQSVPGEPVAGSSKSCAERFPAVDVCRPLLGRQIRRDDDFYAERAGDFERGSEMVLDHVEAEMRAPGGEAVLIEQAPCPRCVFMQRAESLDNAEV